MYNCKPQTTFAESTSEVVIESLADETEKCGGRAKYQLTQVIGILYSATPGQTLRDFLDLKIQGI